jgi:hypothetical protein
MNTVVIQNSGTRGHSLRDRIQAVIFAYETGITQPGPKPTG